MASSFRLRRISTRALRWSSFLRGKHVAVLAALLTGSGAALYQFGRRDFFVHDEVEKATRQKQMARFAKHPFKARFTFRASGDHSTTTALNRELNEVPSSKNDSSKDVLPSLGRLEPEPPVEPEPAPVEPTSAPVEPTSASNLSGSDSQQSFLAPKESQQSEPALDPKDSTASPGPSDVSNYEFQKTIDDLVHQHEANINLLLKAHQLELEIQQKLHQEKAESLVEAALQDASAQFETILAQKIEAENAAQKHMAYETSSKLEHLEHQIDALAQSLDDRLASVHSVRLYVKQVLTVLKFQDELMSGQNLTDTIQALRELFKDASDPFLVCIFDLLQPELVRFYDEQCPHHLSSFEARFKASYRQALKNLYLQEKKTFVAVAVGYILFLADYLLWRGELPSTCVVMRPVILVFAADRYLVRLGNDQMQTLRQLKLAHYALVRTKDIPLTHSLLTDPKMALPASFKVVQNSISFALHGALTALKSHLLVALPPRLEPLV